MIAKDITLRQRRLIVSIVLSASFLSVFTLFLLITAFPKIMAEFNIDAGQVQWITTSYMLAIAVLIPMTAYLIDRFKTRSLMIGAMLLFLFGAVLCFLSPSFEFLILGRVIQGIASGILMPLMQTTLLLVYPRQKRGYALGLAGLVINVAPAIGPPISGLFMTYFQWRSVFLIILPIAAIILILTLLFIPNLTEQKETKIDFISILLSTIGFGGILYGINVLTTSTYAVVMMMLGGLSLLIFVVRQFRLDKPILNLTVLKRPIFALVTIISVLSFSLLISIEAIVPMYIQSAQQLSPFHSGLAVAPGALSLAIMSLLAGKIFDKYGGRSIAMIGFILLSASTIIYYFSLGLNTSLIFTGFFFMLCMAGVGLINMPLMTAGINSLPDSLVAHGTSIINIARQFGGSIGLTFIISFISRETSGVGVPNPIDFLSGVQMAFLVSFIFAAIGLLLTFFLKKS